MANNVPGVNGITGFVNAAPEAPPFEMQGGPADPLHGNFGEQASPYPWMNVPMGPYPGSIDPLPGIVDDFTGNESGLAAGLLAQDPTSDQTPTYHAAPFPKEGPNSAVPDQMDAMGRHEGSTRQLLESLRIHASNTGAALRRLFDFTYGSKQDNWTGFLNEVQGEDLIPIVPGAVSYNAGGFGANDHTSNAYHKANSYGFNTSHRHRRFATGPIPGNTMWMKPGGRPMVRSFTNFHNFPTSGAFAGDDPGYTFGYQGAVLEDVPGEYVAPPQPALASANVDITPVATSSVPEIPLY
jgi:hypothetical protein